MPTNAGTNFLQPPSQLTIATWIRFREFEGELLDLTYVFHAEVFGSFARLVLSKFTLFVDAPASIARQVATDNCPALTDQEFVTYVAHFHPAFFAVAGYSPAKVFTSVMIPADAFPCPISRRSATYFGGRVVVNFTRSGPLGRPGALAFMEHILARISYVSNYITLR